MRLNKVNLCWVLSDGRKGHEIQSLALAKQLAHQVVLMPFYIKQPWLSFAPRIIPGMSHGIIWKQNLPDANNPPDLIITTGRKAAAAGKYLVQKIRQKNKLITHIQILNPKDQASNYDLLLTPEHDLQTGANVISYTGSIHPYSKQWLSQTAGTYKTSTCDYALVLGNPPKSYFKAAFKSDLNRIHSLIADLPLMVCGSPRLSQSAIDLIKTQLRTQDHYWFTETDGQNPYQQILATGRHIFVTSDSINMMNECGATSAAVTILAEDFVQSKKHHRYISTWADRWSPIDSSQQVNFEIPYAIDQILSEQKLITLLNSHN